ncbi:hypothetical protein DID88_005583 [Monilinia fructigena]|uniref:non-specific serine/threonine protein kinase n=1 Tax=Monilinia fructigena TaxID=38457 RepID=A0A395J0J1_9HELO|nr:hypothetical protein DID88_005583 [Monilinia fructigena]
MGSGQFGSVLDVLNTDTNKHYALKLQFELEQFNPSDLRPKYSFEPARTASSEATKSSSQSVERRSLRAKRHQETRAYLLWIRTGHPNICNPEEFVQYTPEHSRGKGDPAMGLYFEHCELGSLDALSHGFRDNDCKPPELFIWHVFHELSSGLAFLHNQHPDYNTLKEHQSREPIFQDDMFGRNVFLKWGPDREGGYPHLKIGDFGVSYTVPHGGHIPDPKLTRGLLDPDPAQKRLSGELYLFLKAAYEERAGLMYRGLPDWIGQKAIKHEFDEKRLKELNEEEGAIERELAAFDRWRNIDTLAQSLFEEYLDSEDRLTDEEFEAMEKQFYEQAAREVDARLEEGGDIVQTSCDNYAL